MSERTAQRMTRRRGLALFGNEKAVESAKAGAMSDERFKAQTRAKTVQQEREELSRSLAARSQFSLLGKGMERS